MTKGDIKFAKVYMIAPNCPDCQNDIYIGSTYSKTLGERMYKHAYTYRNNQRNKSVYYLFEKYGPENLRIDLIKAVNTDNLDDLRKAEQEAMDNIPNINKARAYRKEKLTRQTKKGIIVNVRTEAQKRADAKYRHKKFIEREIMKLMNITV